MEVITKTLDELIDIPPNHFVFDIETTGLNSNYCKVILIGILFNQDNKTVIKQFFFFIEDDEKELLLSFINTIKNYQNHITFNGLTFDIPFLNTRLKKHNIDFYLSKNDDIDILKLIRPFKEKLSLSDCKLKTIEKYLGIHREDTISGKESIDLYKDYSVNQNIDLKEKILLHNYEDIYYLGVIFKIKDILKHKLNVLCIATNNLSLELVPGSFKISKNILSIIYNTFEGNVFNINIYNDSYSIISDEKNLILNVSLDKGRDSNNNTILFYNLYKIIPLKFNDSFLEDNIYSLCNYIIKKELSSL
ncbi:ribonuclease H-like domain-containing protein [Romboutsia ilealis]|uniref:ribonuclease H-like domain-containing protein n=1 Tax=Romboutsia ilealis TaxID=1115758 RepID=UPI0025744CA1|nr:ribonuclease H-like domain-containing protein [Romboutsia ilealis]